MFAAAGTKNRRGRIWQSHNQAGNDAGGHYYAGVRAGCLRRRRRRQSRLIVQFQQFHLVQRERQLWLIIQFRRSSRSSSSTSSSSTSSSSTSSSSGGASNPAVSVADASGVEGNSGMGDLDLHCQPLGPGRRHRQRGLHHLRRHSHRRQRLHRHQRHTRHSGRQHQRPGHRAHRGDTTNELDETLTLTLSNVSANATLGTATATGTIENDDPGSLNDTGITTCSDGANNRLSCPRSDYPGQDAEYGRDANSATNSDSDGHAGFSFVKIGSTGEPLATSRTAPGATAAARRRGPSGPACKITSPSCLGGGANQSALPREGLELQTGRTPPAPTMAAAPVPPTAPATIRRTVIPRICGKSRRGVARI